MYDFLIVEHRDDVGLVTLNRPDVLNAWHSAMRRELAAALNELNDDAQIRAVVITGAGDRAFSAGQDLNEAKSFKTDRAAEWIEEWRALYGAIRGMRKPLIAALNGVAAGSAFQVALQCDSLCHP
jgi:enoyl-CoA hydratase